MLHDIVIVVQGGERIEQKSLAVSISGVMTMIFGAMAVLYSEIGLARTGYYLSDMRLNLEITHPFLEIGIVIMLIGLVAAIIGVLMR